MARAFRNPIGWALLLVAAVLVCASIFSVVPETSQALVVRLGEPVRVVNRYRSDEPFGGVGAGLLAHVPLIEQVFFVDKRVRTLDLDRQAVTAADGQRLDVDAFARYRVVDPLRLYLSAHGDERRLADALKPALGSALRTALGQRPSVALATPALGPVRDELNQVAAQYGAVVTEVRVSRLRLPDGVPLESTLERMRATRQQLATTIRAEGARQAGLVRAEADADAARTYADAFNQDPDFYDFYRSMQSYRATFAADNPTDGTTTFVLSPRSEYFRNFTGRVK